MSLPSERARAGEDVPLDLLTAELRANTILAKARPMILHQRYRDAEDRMQQALLIAAEFPALKPHVQAKIAAIKELMI